MNVFKNLLLLFCLGLAVTVQAQNDCNCPPPTDTEFVCVEYVDIDGTIEIEAFPSACLAECFGLTISNEPCDWDGGPDGPDGEWEDCDCPEPQEGDAVCVLIDWDGVEEIIGFPSACFADCEGLTIVDGECEWDHEPCPWDEEWEECDCPEPQEGDEVCVIFEWDNNVEIFPFPSACYADCEGLDIVDGECDNDWEPEPCDCPEPQEGDEVCVIFEWDGNEEVFPFPSACYAECEGLDIVDGECDNDWEPEPCDCPEPQEGDEVCVIFEWDGIEEVFPFPSACYAECEGLTVVDGECENEWEPEPCDCPEPQEGDEVCVIFEWDGNEEVFPFPSACYAECEGLTIVDGECDNEWEPEPCDCPEPQEGDEVCVIHEWDGNEEIFPFPSACYAECEGLTVVDGECNDEWEDNEWEDENWPEGWDIECFITVAGNATSAQEFLLAMHAECGLPLGDCILNAPIFDTDEEFLTYIATECEGWFGLTAGSSSSDPEVNPYLRLLGNYNNQNTSVSTSQIDNGMVSTKLLQNPVSNMLEIESGKVVIRAFEIINMNGQLLKVVQPAGQSNIHSIEIGELNSGMYLLRVQGEQTSKTMKFVVAK